MSLLNDLIPEVKELLEADAEKYPYLVKGIKNELSNNNMVTDISVRTANQLISYGEVAGVKFEFDSFVNKLYNVFGK